MPIIRRAFLLHAGTATASALAAGPLLAPRRAWAAARAGGARVRPVHDAGQLAAALAAALPGDTILLAAGVYAGDFLAARGGTAEAPVVVAAATPLGATVKAGR